MAEFKHILIINTFGIGDVLFTTPLIETLAGNMPDSKIDFICNRRTSEILSQNRHINRLIIFEKDEFRGMLKKSKVLFLKNLIAFFSDLSKNHYDLVVDLSLGYQFTLIMKLLGVRKRIGFNYRSRGKFLSDRLEINGFCDKHVVEYYLDLLRLVGISGDFERSLHFPLSARDEMTAAKFIDKNHLQDRILIGIIAGGGKSWGADALYRRWPAKNFSYVAGRLLRLNEKLFFLIFGSNEEFGLGEKIVKDLKGSALNLCGCLSLSESASFIKRCAVALCNEGGMLHVAVSQGVKTVSLFGPVDEKVYSPYPTGKDHVVVVARGVSCRPCYRFFKHAKCESHKCLGGIDKDEVLCLMEDMITNHKYSKLAKTTCKDAIS